jgi:hypothetical protein
MHTHTRTHTHTHARTHARTRTHARMHTHARTHARTRTRTRTRTHTNTHTNTLPPPTLHAPPPTAPPARWAAICVSNLLVRLATFPVTVLMQQKGGRMTVRAREGVEGRGRVSLSKGRRRPGGGGGGAARGGGRGAFWVPVFAGPPRRRPPDRARRPAPPPRRTRRARMYASPRPAGAAGAHHADAGALPGRLQGGAPRTPRAAPTP